ncbi:MAG: HD domain-containing protein [Bacteriovoracaceae bacterium]|jgi:putative hydrolases of HD superfamily|nr:HD domain-containing protein [Bacteriovoracaceae bacterium]
MESLLKLCPELDFLVEIDRLKGVLRMNKIVSDDRRENSAEHSWHLAMMVMTLAGRSGAPIDILKAIKMALIHDVVEIEAGDVFIYDDKARVENEQKEREAAKLVFGRLSPDLSRELHDLWIEFEDANSLEAQFVKTIDRLQPVLCNYLNDGGTWVQHKIEKSRVLEKVTNTSAQFPELHGLIHEILDNAERKGHFSN